MATKKKIAEAPQPPPELPRMTFPHLESFIEGASAGDVASLFSPIRDSLGALKGPRAEQGKKVGKAIARTEELLSYLLQVREKIEAERKGGKGSRK
jgi:hypothetical protein